MTDYHWTATGLIHYPLIGHVDLSPDAVHVLYTIRSPYLTGDTSEFRNQIHVASTAATHDAHPVALTHGDSASQPRWSPDGRYIAFLRKTPDTGQAGIWIMPSSGGEPWPLTGRDNQIRNAVSKFQWRPDSTAIAFLTIPWDEEKTRRVDMHDDVLHWRVAFDFAHLFVVELAGPGGTLPDARALTSGRRHVTGMGWSPDGSKLAYTHRENPLLDSWQSTHLALVSADGNGGARSLGPISSRDADPAFSPDGQWVACEVGHEERRWSYASRIHLFSARDGTARPLAPVSDEQPLLLGWSPDSTGVYVVNQNGFGTEVAFLHSSGDAATITIAPNKLITQHHLNASGQLALVMEDFHEQQSIYWTNLLSAQRIEHLQLLVQPSADGYPNGPLPRTKLLRWETLDGLEIEGILYLPTTYDETSDESLPLLIHVHGGPASVFQRQFAATPYYYTPAAMCERGIAMLRCNPRGSGGHGRQFRFANVADWGEGDYRDLQQGVDTIADMGIADPDRLGICGWSYGGYMTSWTITQTNRFRAASIGAAVTNPMSFNGTADIPGFIPDYFGGEAWEIFDFYRDHSPVFHVDRANTPSIIQHGSADERVPLEQGLQYFNALKRRGVPVDMYIYPRQGHAIEEPRLLADAIQRNLDWFTSTLVLPDKR